MKNSKQIPTFSSEAEEFEFWSNANSTDYINWDEAKEIKFINLKKTTKKITLSLPFDMIEKIKIRANKIDVPYQSLIKMYILKSYNEFSGERV